MYFDMIAVWLTLYSLRRRDRTHRRAQSQACAFGSSSLFSFCADVPGRSFALLTPPGVGWRVKLLRKSGSRWVARDDEGQRLFMCVYVRAMCVCPRQSLRRSRRAFQAAVLGIRRFGQNEHSRAYPRNLRKVILSSSLLPVVGSETFRVQHLCAHTRARRDLPTQCACASDLIAR